MKNFLRRWKHCILIFFLGIMRLARLHCNPHIQLFFFFLFYPFWFRNSSALTPLGSSTSSTSRCIPFLSFMLSTMELFWSQFLNECYLIIVQFQDAVDCPEWIVPFHVFKSLAEEVIFCSLHPAHYKQSNFDLLWDPL